MITQYSFHFILEGIQTDLLSPLGQRLQAHRLRLSLRRVPGRLDVSLYSLLFHDLRMLIITSCYNNCPNDIRAPSVQQQVDSYCRTASLLSPKTTASTPKTKTQGSSNSEETSGSAAPSNDDASTTDSGPSQTAGSQSQTSATTGARSSSTNAAAAPTMGSVAGLVMAVAGAAVAMI